MRVFKTKEFARFARKERISDASLRDAIDRAERGIVDADIGSDLVKGGSLIKQRVPRQGQGRSGGYRTIVAYRAGDFAVFLHGFAKNAKENLDDAELEALREAASVYLSMDDDVLSTALKSVD